MSYKRETIEEYGATIYEKQPDGTLALEVGDTREIWFPNNDFAGFALTREGQEYEFASSYNVHRAVKRLIDTVWTCIFRKVSQTEVLVLKYTDADGDGIRNFKTLPLLETKEDGSERRTLVGIYVQPHEGRAATNWASTDTEGDTRYFKVGNPRHIFSYGA